MGNFLVIGASSGMGNAIALQLILLAFCGVVARALVVDFASTKRPIDLY